MAYDYEAQIKRLTENPSGVYREWTNAQGMFDLVGDHLDKNEDGLRAGCLTQIRARDTRGAFINGKFNKELTDKIKNDERITPFEGTITPDDFPVFLEYRKIIDELTNRN